MVHLVAPQLRGNKKKKIRENSQEKVNLLRCKSTVSGLGENLFRKKNIRRRMKIEKEIVEIDLTIVSLACY